MAQSRDEVERMASNEGIKYCNKNHLGAAAYSKLHSCFVAGAMYGVSLPTPSTDEWVDVRERLPDDGEKVYFNSHTYGNVSIGFFYKIDSFNRENMFISTDGAHFPLNDVSHWMLRHIPTPPQ